MERCMFKLMTMAVLVGATLTAGCNTVHGAGKDAKSVGKAVSKTVEKTK